MTNEKRPPRARGTGCLYRRPDSQVWWIKYSRYGKPYRESTGTIDDKKAEKFLLNRLGEIQQGTFIGPKREKIRITELAEDLLRDYKIKDKRSIEDVRARWNLHLKPFFQMSRVIDITSDRIQKYVDGRQNEGAANATINRELAALKRMFHLGAKSTPPKVLRIPAFPHLGENNIRKGFLEDGQQRKLIKYCPDLWFRSLVECGRTYGWRISEFLNLTVSQIDLARRLIRLEPGTTKNRDGREVLMTDAVYTLLRACVRGKSTGTAVFTRPNGKPVKDFRETWYRACDSAGLGKILCRHCSNQTHGVVCECGSDEYRYTGLIFHDLRRTAARNLRRANVAEGVIMKIGGWRTRSVFERYNIVNQDDISDALVRLQQLENEQKQARFRVRSHKDQRGLKGHVSVHSRSISTNSTPAAHPEVAAITSMASANQWCREGGSNPHEG